MAVARRMTGQGHTACPSWPGDTCPLGRVAGEPGRIQAGRCEGTRERERGGWVASPVSVGFLGQLRSIQRDHRPLQVIGRNLESKAPVIEGFLLGINQGLLHATNYAQCLGKVQCDLLHRLRVPFHGFLPSVCWYVGLRRKPLR